MNLSFKILSFFLSFFLIFSSCNKVGESIAEIQEEVSQNRLEKSNTPYLHSDGYLMFECEEKFIDFLTSKEEEGTLPEDIDKEFGFSSFLNNTSQTPENLDLLESSYFTGTLQFRRINRNI